MELVEIRCHEKADEASAAAEVPRNSLTHGQDDQSGSAPP